jgi:UDP-glucuronate decarboxylase
MRILVTGGAGFIGSHLCAYLLDKGHEVICLDNFFTGRKNNVDPLRANPRFELVRHDIVQPYWAEVDQVYNLACPASPVHYQYNPIKTIKCSTVGVINMLGLAKRCGARFLQASTSEVYGDPEVHPQPESYRGNVNTLGLRACYDEGKRVSESLCMDYHRSNGVDVRLIRIFNTYGPAMQMDDGRVVTNFIMQALRGEPLTIYGDGNQTRSIQYVSVIVVGMFRMMLQEGFIGPVNLGNPREFTIRELAEAVLAKTGVKTGIDYRPLPEDDPTRRKPDISLAKEKLGWEPVVPLETGLEKTIPYFRKRLADEAG